MPAEVQTLVNVGGRLSATARQNPDGLAVVMPRGRDATGKRIYQQVTFRQLDEDSNRIAASLLEMGVPPGARIVLLVRPSVDFISLVFALFKAGVVTVLIDPGMGRRCLIECLEQVQPDGFVAIPLAHAVRSLLPWKFPQARFNVTVGRRWFWSGRTLAQLRQRAPREVMARTQANDPAAIIFTTGSTGPPKGVLYSHGNFDRQASEIRDFYQIQPGEVDLPGFPLFALFNCAMGVATVIPDMDPTRPADVNPENILEAVRDWNVTQAFGSPALWNTVATYCEQQRATMPSLRRVLSAGAPVPPHVLQRLKQAIHPEGDIHTPYGATEALPVASIAASEVLAETAAQTRQGAGVCVGRRFPGIGWKVIAIGDEALPRMDLVQELPRGEIGELMVCGPVVTRRYVTRLEANALHKVEDGGTIWHRMGDVGYLDEQDRFWFCGRKSHRVRAAHGSMFTIPCEAILNQHPQVYRSALVGLGEPGRQRPIMVVETWPDQRPSTVGARAKLLADLQQAAQAHILTRHVQHILLHPSLPVDIRHNAKIFREKLAQWAARRLPASADT